MLHPKNREISPCHSFIVLDACVQSLTYIYPSGLSQFRTFPATLNSLSRLSMLQTNLPALESFPYVSDCQELERLSITSTNLSVFPSSICSLKKLKSLDIRSNKFLLASVEIEKSWSTLVCKYHLYKGIDTREYGFIN